MLICFLTCLCLYLYVLVLFVMLCLDIGVQFLLAMFMLKSTCWLLCLVLLQPFISCYAFFLCFGPQVGCRSRSYGLGLHPYAQAYIKGFGSFHLCMFLLAYFFALDPCLFGQIQVLAMLCALHGLVLVGLQGHLLVWLHPSLLWLIRM